MMEHVQLCDYETASSVGLLHVSNTHVQCLMTMIETGQYGHTSYYIVCRLLTLITLYALLCSPLLGPVDFDM